MDFEKIAAANGMLLTEDENNIFFAPLVSPEFFYLVLKKFRTQTHFVIVRHRNEDLTDRYHARRVSKEWVYRFIEANAARARDAIPTTFDSIPQSCKILKKTSTKAVVRTPEGFLLTLWKGGKPQIESGTYGKQTREWERHEAGVTNWHYDK